MLYNLFRPFADQFILFNLFRYITFRSGAACLTALLVSFVLGPPLIRWLKSVQRQGQPIRMDGPERHLIEKKGTPTMGGVLILFALTASTLLWADLRNLYVWAVLFVTLGYGALGFADDYMKLSKRNHRGVSGRTKLIAQAVIGLIAAAVIAYATRGPLGTSLSIPVFKEVLIPLGVFFPVFGMLVMIGSSSSGAGASRARLRLSSAAARHPRCRWRRSGRGAPGSAGCWSRSSRTCCRGGPV